MIELAGGNLLDAPVEVLVDTDAQSESEHLRKAWERLKQQHWDR